MAGLLAKFVRSPVHLSGFVVSLAFSLQGLLLLQEFVQKDSSNQKHLSFQNVSRCLLGGLYCLLVGTSGCVLEIRNLATPGANVVMHQVLAALFYAWLGCCLFSGMTGYGLEQRLQDLFKLTDQQVGNLIWHSSLAAWGTAICNLVLFFFLPPIKKLGKDTEKEFRRRVPFRPAPVPKAAESQPGSRKSGKDSAYGATVP